MTQDSDDLLAMVFAAPIHLAPTQVKHEGGDVVVTTSESTHVETHRSVTHHEETHRMSSFYQESHQSHSESRQIHTGGHIEASSVIESEQFNDLESERNHTASPAMSTATSVSVRSSVSQQHAQHRNSAKQETRAVTVQSYAVNKSECTSDGDESTVTVVSSHRQTDEAPTPTVESEVSTTVAPVRTPSHDAVIEQFKSLHKRESIASSVEEQEQNHHKGGNPPADGIGEGVKSVKVTHYGFDAKAHQMHSHSQQEAPEDLHVLTYQELGCEPLQMTSDRGSVHVVERQHHHEEYHSGTEIRTHESDDEPFTFEKVEYVTEKTEHEPNFECISTEPIITEVFHEEKTSQAHSRAESTGDAKETYAQDVLRSSSQHSSSHELTQHSYSSLERPKQRSQQSIASSTKAYDPYKHVEESRDYNHTHEDVREKELVPHVVGPKVRDELRPVPLKNEGAYKITEYKFVSRSDQHKEGTAHKSLEKERNIQKSSESDTHKRQSQSRHTHKEHRQSRVKPIDVDSLRSSQDDIEIRTEMHLSPASTLVRQSHRPDPDLPPETGAVKMLRQRIELGENNNEHHKKAREIDIFESLDANKNYKSEDIPRSEINEQHRHTFHELYYRQPIEGGNAHWDHSQLRHSTVVNTVHDGYVQQHVEPYEGVHLRHVSQTSGQQSLYKSNQEQVNLRSINQAYQASDRQTNQQSFVHQHAEKQYQQNQSNQHQQMTTQTRSIYQTSKDIGRQAIHGSYTQERTESVLPLQRTQHHQETSKHVQHVQSHSAAHNPSGQLVCTCNSCAIHGRNAHHTDALTKRTEEVRELDYSQGAYAQQAGYQKSVSQVSRGYTQQAGYQKSTSQVSHTGNKFIGSGAIVQKSEQHDDSRTHKRTTSIHRIEDVVHSTGGVQVGGVVGNVVDTRTAQGELYMTRNATFAPHVQQKSIASYPVSAPPSVVPTAAARMSRPQSDEKYNSMRVVKNVRAFVNEWGQKDFVPPYPRGVHVTSPTRRPVTPTFTETKVTTTTRNISGPIQKVALPGLVRSNAESAQAHSEVTKEQTIVKTEAHHLGKADAAAHQQIVSSPALHAPVPAKRESVIIASAHQTSAPVEFLCHHHEHHCCCCPHHCHEYQCQLQHQQHQECFLQHSYKSPQQALIYKSEHSQPMLKYESYATHKVEEHSGAQHHLQHEEHRGQAEMEESFTLVPVSVRRADYEHKSAMSHNITRSSGLKPMIDVFSV